ncbi:hypothetical protein D1007_62596 [Hordeum vulgare]|nr:hypothetical protein D1007_62596 [Hordeum vulgare]
MLTAVIDKARKFLSAGKTNLHGHAQGTSKCKDTLMVSHKPEETLDALSHEQMVQFLRKLRPMEALTLRIFGGYFILCTTYVWGS